MVLSHPIPSAVFDSVDQSIDQSFNQSLNQQNNQLTNQSIHHHGFLQNLCSTPLLQRSLSRQPRPPSSRNQGKQKKKRKKNTNIISIPPKPQQKKKTPQLTSFSLFFFPTKQQCDSDDACKTPCRTPNIQAQGVNVTPSEKIQDEARRRFGDAHCENKRCACAVSGRRRKEKRKGEGEGEEKKGRYL